MFRMQANNRPRFVAALKVEQVDVHDACLENSSALPVFRFCDGVLEIFKGAIGELATSEEECLRFSYSCHRAAAVA